MAEKLATRSDLHLPRKIWHVSAGLAALLLYYYADFMTVNRAALASGLLGLLGFAVDFIRLRWPPFNAIFMERVRLIARESERNHYSGFPFFALGVALSLLLFPPRLAELSVFFLVFADPIASLVGVKYGKRKIFASKSMEGFVAAWATCFMITVIFCASLQVVSSYLMIFCILAGFIGAVSELLSVRLDDNFSIPVFSGMGVTLLNFFFKIFPL